MDIFFIIFSLFLVILSIYKLIEPHQKNKLRIDNKDILGFGSIPLDSYDFEKDCNYGLYFIKTPLVNKIPVKNMFINRWLKNEGEFCIENEGLVEIFMDGFIAEAYSHQSGIIRHLLKEDETVNVGVLICYLDKTALPTSETKDKNNFSTVSLEIDVDSYDTTISIPQSTDEEFYEVDYIKFWLTFKNLYSAELSRRFPLVRSANENIYIELISYIEEIVSKQGYHLLSYFGITDRIVYNYLVKRESNSHYYYRYEPELVKVEQFATKLYDFSYNIIHENYTGKQYFNISFNETEEIFEEVLKGIDKNQFNYLIPEKDDGIQRVLYSIDSSLYKVDLLRLNEEIGLKPKEEIILRVNDLLKLNKDNYNLRAVYYEVCKIVSELDSREGLLYYSIYKQLSIKRGNKYRPLPLKLKQLFKNNNLRYEKYLEISSVELPNIKTIRDQKKLRELINEIFESKIRKIEIDKERLKEIRTLHSDTVQKLNIILNEGEETGEDTDIRGDTSLKINFDEIQKTFLGLFESGKLSLEQAKIFADSNKTFLNSFVDSINEVFYNVHEDTLIEEEDDYFIINSEYFQEIKSLYGCYKN